LGIDRPYEVKKQESVEKEKEEVKPMKGRNRPPVKI
jgi:hypothetical protein